MELTNLEADVVSRARENRGRLAAESMSGPEKRAAFRAVVKGALYSVEFANGQHFETTDAGRAVLDAS